MAANLRLSTTSVNGKNYLGGAIIEGTAGVYSPSTTASNILFDEIQKSENIAGTPDYRCLYLRNDFTNKTIYNPRIEIISTTNTANFEIGLLTNKNVLGQSLASETSAPTGISFLQEGTIQLIKNAKTTDDFLAPGQYVGFWLKRTPSNPNVSGTVTGELVFQLRYRT